MSTQQKKKIDFSSLDLEERKRGKSSSSMFIILFFFAFFFLYRVMLRRPKEYNVVYSLRANAKQCNDDCILLE